MKKGFEILFMAPQSQRHHGKPILDTVIAIAKANNIHRYTRRVDAESIGKNGRTHAAHFFELADEPEEVLFVLGTHRADQLLNAVKAESLHVFCVCRAIEFGHIDGIDPDGEGAPGTG